MKLSRRKSTSSSLSRTASTSRKRTFDLEADLSFFKGTHWTPQDFSKLEQRVPKSPPFVANVIKGSMKPMLRGAGVHDKVVIVDEVTTRMSEEETRWSNAFIIVFDAEPDFYELRTPATRRRIEAQFTYAAQNDSAKGRKGKHTVTGRIATSRIKKAGAVVAKRVEYALAPEEGQRPFRYQGTVTGRMSMGSASAAEANMKMAEMKIWTQMELVKMKAQDQIDAYRYLNSHAIAKDPKP